jgi:hypothetical protein
VKQEEVLELLSKSVIATATGGQLTTEQAEKFIDTVVAQDQFLQKIQTVTMSSKTYQLNTVGVSSRIMRKAAEGTDPGFTQSITIIPKSLVSQEVILPYDITFSFLEENIQKENAEDLINNVFAKAFRNDLLDLAFNGDEVSTDPFLQINDGYLKIAGADSSIHSFTIPAIPTYKDVFKGMLALLPNKWKNNPSELCFLVSPDIEEAYRSELSNRNTALGDSMVTDFRTAQYNGIDVYPVPFLPGGEMPNLLLTKYQNLAVGLGRDIRIGKQVQERKRIVEYTISAKIDFNYVTGDMIVLGAKE